MAMQAVEAADTYSWQQLPVSTNGLASGLSGMSADGNTLYMVAPDEDSIIYSSDRGATWSARTFPVTNNVHQLAVSASGTKLVALNNNRVFISTDSAQTWSAAIMLGCNIGTLDMSADGTKLVGGCLNGNIYTSTNGGLNWTQRTGAGSHYWQSVAISGDGSRMVAAQSDSSGASVGSIYTSTDDGVTWVPQAGAGSRYWRSVDVAGDGSRVVAVAAQSGASGSAGDIYRSLDGGVSWTQQSGLGEVNSTTASIVISGDGQTVIMPDRPSDNLLNSVVRISADGGASWAYTQEFDYYYAIDNAVVSVDGETILIAHVQAPVVLSRDQGASWSIVSDIRSSTNVGWTSMAMTVDGQKVWLANWFPSGPLQYSSDSGASWEDKDAMGSHDWDGVAVSSDGKYVTAAGGCSWGETYLHTSSDGGESWTQKLTDQVRKWDEIAMSSDGRVQAATVCGSYFYVSRDYGVTWSPQMTDTNRNWTDVVVSADGKYLVALSSMDGVYHSSDSGQTWTQSVSAGAKQFGHGAITADGKTIIAATNLSGGDSVYRSDDYGVTWQAINSLGTSQWQGVAMSADGKKMAVSGNSSGVHISTDGGLTWDLQTLTSDYYDLSMSADGTVLYASTWGGVHKAVSSTPPVAPSVDGDSIVAGSSEINGQGTPGSTMIVTLPGGDQVTSQVSVTGEFTVVIPGGSTLEAGDSVTLQQRSAAGILGASTTVTVIATDSTLSNTGTNFWILIVGGAGLVFATSFAYRRLSVRRLSF